MSVIGLIGTRGGNGKPGGTIAGSLSPVVGGGSLAYGNGKYVASVMAGLSNSSNGTSILVSADAVSWKLPTVTYSGSAPFVNPEDILFLNGLFIALGTATGAMFTSSDGETWTYKNAGMYFNDLIWDGVRYIGVRSDPLATGVWTSPDLVTWAKLSTQSIGSIACIGGVYVACGFFGSSRRIYRSTDLATWTQIFVGTAFTTSFTVDAANGRFIVTGISGGIIQSSTDGASWTPGTGFLTSLIRVLWTGSEYLFVSDTQIQKSTSLTSATGSTFTQDHNDSKGNIFPTQAGRFSSVYVGTTIVQALPGGDFSRSTDSGATFSYFYGDLGYSYFCGANGIPEVARSPGSEVLPICGKAAGTSLFVGMGGAILDRTSSTDGTKRTSGTTANLRAAAYSGSKYVAVGDGGLVLASSDRITWSVAATLGGNLTSVIWDATAALFIAVGQGGAIYTSPAAGTSWTARTSGTASKLRCIRATTHPTMKFVAVGDYSTLCYSSNGTAWSAITISYETGAASRTLTSIAYGFFSSYGAGLFMVGCSSDASVYRTESVTLPWIAKEVGMKVFDIEFTAPGTFHLYGTGRTALTAT